MYFNDVKFVNISISSLSVFAKESIKMLDDNGFEDKHKIYCIREMMTISYYQNIILHLLLP